MYELHVDGMTCGGCANSVKRSIQAIDSVATVDVDLASKKVRVNTQASIDDVSAAVTGAGYEVVSAQAA
jgi:copper chaperone